MKKEFLILSLIFASQSLFAQKNLADSSQLFLLIIRYKTNLKAADADKLKSNIRHWGVFIGELAQTGKLVTGYRPATTGRTITGSMKTSSNSAFNQAGEEISSIFVIKAASIDEASAVAQKCPIYEMDGSVEIRPVNNTTN